MRQRALPAALAPLLNGCSMYWAARQGHTPVIEYLVTQGVRVDQQNKVREDGSS